MHLYVYTSYTHIHIYIYIYIHLFIHLFIHGFMYVCVYIYIYIYMYIRTSTVQANVYHSYMNKLFYIPGHTPLGLQLVLRSLEEANVSRQLACEVHAVCSY